MPHILFHFISKYLVWPNQLFRKNQFKEYMPSEGVHILHQLCDGNVQAFKSLFNKHYKPMVLKAWTMLNDKMEAEDTVQKLFVDLWENKFWNHVHTSPEAYMYTALRNRFLKIIRHTKLETAKECGYLAEQEIYTETGEAEGRDIYPNLKNLMNDMPKQRLQTLNLVYLENKKYQEAADEMGISINSVKTHLKLALKYLRSRINN